MRLEWSCCHSFPQMKPPCATHGFKRRGFTSKLGNTPNHTSGTAYYEGAALGTGPLFLIPLNLSYYSCTPTLLFLRLFHFKRRIQVTIFHFNIQVVQTIYFNVYYTVAYLWPPRNLLMSSAAGHQMIC